MRFIYTLFIYLVTPVVLGRLFYLGTKSPAYREKWQQRFGFIQKPVSDKPIIWIHAVSVGEVNAASPLIEYYLEHKSNYQIVVTTVTPTGAMTLRQRFEDKIEHYFFPYDLPGSVKRFCKILNPKIFITMETEIWPNLFNQCQNFSIPVLIINARLSKKSYRGYKLVSALTRQTLQHVDAIATQTENDRQHFILLGASEDKVTVKGNLKFDVVVPASITEQAESIRRYLSVNRPIWIAASTQEGEEGSVLKAHKQVLESYGDAILILAPRHPDRISKVAMLCDENDLTYIKRTDQTEFNNKCQVYLLDTLGELLIHYAASQLAFVGGSLVDTGGQNMMEPASLALPVISGPSTYNFSEITELLQEQGVLIKVNDSAELARTVCDLFADANHRHQMGEKGRNLIESNKGNIHKLIKMMDTHLAIK